MFATKKPKKTTIFTRLSLVVMILAVLALALPQPAAAATISFDVIAAKVNESVTIRAKDFPANVKFNVRMDVAGNRGIDGIVVAEIDSGKGGAFEATFRIPAELHGKPTLAIRLEAKTGGWFAYNWFNNRTFGTTPPVPVTGAKAYITFSGVKQNESVTVKGYNFPVNTNMRVRVGPYFTFFRDYVDLPTINTGSSGSFEVTLNIPQVVKDVEMVTVRLDGGGTYAFNAFKNVTSGSVTPVNPPASASCQITATTPGTALGLRADFDTVWTVKNTSSRTWDLASVDYMFVSGTRMQKYADRFDLPQTVKPGESIKIVVDMVAPEKAGTYTTNWALVEGQTTLCTLPFNLRVR